MSTRSRRATRGPRTPTTAQSTRRRRRVRVIYESLTGLLFCPQWISRPLRNTQTQIRVIDEDGLVVARLTWAGPSGGSASTSTVPIDMLDRIRDSGPWDIERYARLPERRMGRPSASARRNAPRHHSPRIVLTSVPGRHLWLGGRPRTWVSPCNWIRLRRRVAYETPHFGGWAESPSAAAPGVRAAGSRPRSRCATAGSPASPCGATPRGRAPRPAAHRRTPTKRCRRRSASSRRARPVAKPA